ncbi:MAG: hypothetical protein KDB18_10400 [Salinibacterium sp.]|nr:hypothetical protein [Salinibacterium sp.]
MTSSAADMFPGRHKPTRGSEDERPFIRLAASPVRRRVLLAGAAALVALVGLLVIGRPQPIPARFGSAIPGVVVALREDGRVVDASEARPTDRHIIVQAGRGFFYDSWGRFEFNVMLYASDPLSSQNGGGLTDTELAEVEVAAARAMSELPGLPPEFVTALRSPDLTYRTRSYWMLGWRLVVGGLGLVLVLTAWPWIRFLTLLPMLRRRRRLCFDRCPNCNYDLTGTEPPYDSCTECGSVWYPEELDRRVVV